MYPKNGKSRFAVFGGILRRKKTDKTIIPPEPCGSEGTTYMIRGKMMSCFE